MFNITPDEAIKKFTTLEYKGKKLVADCFGRADFIYVAEIREDQTVWLSGILKTSRKEIPIEEVDILFEGPPAGFIKGNSLHFIGSDVTYRELARLPSSITLNQLQELRDEAVEVLVFGEENIKKAPFRLQLLDPFGVTARLLTPEGKEELSLTDYRLSPSGLSCRSDKVFDSLLLLKSGGWRIETAKGDEVLLFEKMESDVEEKEGSLSLTGHLCFEGEKAPLSSLPEKGRQIPLEGGKVGLLPDHFKLDSRLLKPVAKNQVGLIYDLIGEKVFTRSPTLFTPKQKIAPSPLFHGTLRPYQEEGVSWLYFLYQNGFSGFLADDMGLGKTVQTLAFLSLLPPGSPILIIMPTSLKFNWQKEIERFLPQRAMDITSVSFHELRAQPEVYLKTFWEAVIVDEAQAIKNRATQTFKAAAALKSRFRLSISGTPIENRLEELLTHFEFLQPDLELPDDPRMLKKWVAPFMLRRNKSTVLKELPEKIESTVEVELFAEEKEIYDRFLSEAKEQGWDSQNPIQILEVILRLRQLACHPRLAGFPIENSSKMKLVVSDLESLVGEGRKTLVFSQFTSFLSLVGKELDALQIPYLTFTGETKDREGVVTAFQSEAGAQVMLMSLKAGGVGLNLTAADTVLILDPWWNQAAEEQAISRAHRIGQKQTLFVKRYLSRGTIEEKVALLKAHKKSLADEVIGEAIEDNGSVLEELLRLL